MFSPCKIRGKAAVMEIMINQPSWLVDSHQNGRKFSPCNTAASHLYIYDNYQLPKWSVG